MLANMCRLFRLQHSEPNSYFIKISSKAWVYFMKTHYSSDVEAIDLAYKIYGDKSDLGTNTSKDPIFAVHALLGSKENWDNLSKGLHKKTGRTVIAVDCRNHGDSGHSPNHTYKHLAWDLKKLMEKLNLTKISLIGHSMGGRAAQVFSLWFPHLVTSFVSLDLTPVYTSPAIVKAIENLHIMSKLSIPPNTPKTKAMELADDHLKAMGPDVTIRKYILSNFIKTETGIYTYKVNLPSLIKNYSEIIGFPTDVQGRQYHGPTLFVGGTKSDSTRFGDLPKIREYFPLAEIVMIEDGHHFMHVQKPNEVIEIVYNFLNKLE